MAAKQKKKKKNEYVYNLNRLEGKEGSKKDNKTRNTAQAMQCRQHVPVRSPAHPPARRPPA